MAVINRLQLVQFGKSVSGDLQNLVERRVQKLYPLLVLHRDLTKKNVWILDSCQIEILVLFNLRHVGEKVAADSEI